MPDFPPLFSGREVADEPFEAAIAAARDGCDAGLILYRPAQERLEAALVLAPDVPLAEAASMLLVAGNGFADAFGALAPSEIAIHLDWPGGFRVEGGRCGALRAAAPTAGDGEVPGWLVLGLSVVFARPGIADPGDHPDETDLAAEGVDLTADEMLSAWARHTLSWIAKWEDAGMAPVHRDWLARAWGCGGPVTVVTPARTVAGTFQGLDAQGGMLLKGGDGTALIPLTEVLDRRC